MIRRKAAAISTILTVCLGGTAIAADVTSQPLDAVSWTGFYGGLNLGLGFARSGFDYSAMDPSSELLLFVYGGKPPPGDVFSQGLLGGAQIGFNWEVGSGLVLGLEADYAMSGVEGTANGSTEIGSPEWPVTATVTEKLEGFGTVRGRVGFLASDNLMIYGTGGLAFGRVAQYADYTMTGDGAVGTVTDPVPFVCFPDEKCFQGSKDAWKVGWTAGAGLEYAVAQHWSIGGEYLYASLPSGNVEEKANKPFPTLPCCSSFKAEFDDTTVQVVRVKLNYRF